MKARAAGPALPAPTPAQVGLERRKLELRRQRDIQRRIAEYKATMKAMKGRGVRIGKTKGASAAVLRDSPLQVFAEGGSWFKYPAFARGGVIPDGRGICFQGPWLEPTFMLRGFPNMPATGFAVVKEMLQFFAGMLQSLEAAHARVTFLNGQVTLNPVTASWHNELHPEAAGFEAFADLFHQTLKAIFPTRVA